MKCRCWILAGAMALVLGFCLVSTAPVAAEMAYPNYSQGCNNCHGEFESPDSPREDWSATKHLVHQQMVGFNCVTCHDGSPGINTENMVKCAACHGHDYTGIATDPNLQRDAAVGMRAHHLPFVGSTCTNCHSGAPAGADPTSLPEDTPTSFGINPCDGSEDWEGVQGEGLDNDGDGLYDMNDPDCGGGGCTSDADCDDQVSCTADVCDTGTGECSNTADDALCDDGDVCNGAESCDAVNDCQSGQTLDCNDGVGCTDDSCDPVSGCSNAANDANCTDGEFCNGDETCDATNDCQAGSDPCPGQNCDETGDVCVPIGCQSNDECDDETFCNGAETCDTSTGDCQAGTPPSCDDGVGCTVDSCDVGTDSCDNVADDALCDNGMFCDGAETCDAVSDCQAGSDPCPGQDCDETGDVCVPSGCTSDADCDDGLFCTVDSCDVATGQCGAISACPPAILGCVQVNASCDEDNDQCLDFADDSLCDNGMFCDGSETCDADTGECQLGVPVDCDDGVGCTVDSCNDTTDACDNAPDDGLCPDDGLFCSGTEFCDAVNDCSSTGDPCTGGTTCNEDTDICEDTGDGKAMVCHKGRKTLNIGAESVEDHLGHGDSLGPCP